MKVRHGKRFMLHEFNPVFPLGILAFWAMTIATTVVAYFGNPAIRASVQMPSQGISSTYFKGIERFTNISIWLVFLLVNM
jgi:hypothetical protein